MLRPVHSLLFVVAVLAVAVCPAAAFAQEPPVKCLMMGMGPHGENVMDNVLADIKANYPSVEITPSENIEDLKIENLRNYKVLMLIALKVENGNPPDFVKESIPQFLKEGGGLFVTHFAVANVQEWRDSIDLFGAMWVSGKSTHGPYHEFRVDMVDETHPIVEGVKPFIINDELYYNLLLWPDIHVIMTADEQRAGETVAQPMLFTHYVYNARCVYFALGHDVKSVEPPEFRKIVVQSIEWAACRR